MGQESSKLGHLCKGIRENQSGLTEVELDGVQLSEKTVRKLADSLKKNRSARFSMRAAEGCTVMHYMYAV